MSLALVEVARENQDKQIIPRIGIEECFFAKFIHFLWEFSTNFFNVHQVKNTQFLVKAWEGMREQEGQQYREDLMYYTEY